MPANESITILFKGGRLATWYQLSAAQKSAFEQAHVDLMLHTASQHNLRRLEGFRLIAPQGGWERFWIIEFPTLIGAEAWIEAEMAPPYGRYGFYDYHLARQVQPETQTAWLPNKTETIIPLEGDPHQVPNLSIDNKSVVVFLYEWDAPDSVLALGNAATIPPRAEAQGATRLEQFHLIAPSAKWTRSWLVELPTLEAAEAWIAAEAAATQSDGTERHFQLTRKWAPSYFVNWLSADK